jgi:hypothetical protein
MLYAITTGIMIMALNLEIARRVRPVGPQGRPESSTARRDDRDPLVWAITAAGTRRLSLRSAVRLG